MESYSMLGAGSILPEGARVPAFEVRYFLLLLVVIVVFFESGVVA